MVRLGNRQAVQQIGIELVSGRGLARAGARNLRLDPHYAHQSLHALAVDRAPFGIQRERHPPRAIEWQFEMQLNNAAHHGQIVRPSDGRGPVDA
jgi:hypothetical protein